MRAWVFTETGKLMEKEVADAILDESTETGRRGAVLRPRYLSPCTSDVYTVYRGAGPRRENMILGHEGLCEITALGSEVKDFSVGELVAVSAVMPDAENGSGHEGSPFSACKLGRNINGMWAERFFVPDADRNLSHIPEGVSVKQALMSVDVMATGFSAAEAANIKPGQTVAVIGTGAIGLMAIAAAKEMGAAHIIAVGSEKRKTCVKLAEQYGAGLYLSYRDGGIVYQRDAEDKAEIQSKMRDAENGGKQIREQEEGAEPKTEAVPFVLSDIVSEAFAAKRHPLANATKSRAVDAILNLTHNKGVDAVLICGGGSDALMQACDMVRYGSGVVVNAAYMEGEGTVSLPIFSLGKGMAGKTFRFVLSKGGRSVTDRMLAMIQEGKIDPAPLVTKELCGFKEIPMALSMMREKQEDIIKLMVTIP